MLTKVRVVWGVSIAVIAVVLVTAYLVRHPTRSSEELLEEARMQLALRQYVRAEKLAVQSSAATNPSPWALLVAAEAVLKSDRYAEALEYYKRVPRDSAEVASSADFGEAEMLCHLGRISDSEAKLRQLLELVPSHGLAHYRLAFILNVTGRRWEAQSHLMHLVRAGSATEEHLLLLGNSQRMIDAQSLLQVTSELAPDDPLPHLGAARAALSLNRRDEARRLLGIVLAKLPNETEALVRMGQLYVDEPDVSQFICWSAALPKSVGRHPDIWMLRGLFAQRRDQSKAARRCFWEALRLDPEHLAACHHLGRAFIEANDLERAKPFIERAELLQRLSTVLDDLFHHRDHVESIRRATMLTRQLGRFWEVASWSNVALSIDPNLEWARQTIAEIVPLLRSDLPQTHPDADPARRIDLSNIPVPHWNADSPQEPDEGDAKGIVADIRFNNEAKSTGLDFMYENAGDPSTPGARIFETTGGGAGVIDYDNDGWPDLYFTQGGTQCRYGSSPQSDDAIESIDRLYRNQRGVRFLDITSSAGLGDPEFSQGVAVGDFDNDGFQDLYLANFGQNRLYRNRGDGTFADVTSVAGIRGLLWTTSCLICDLNGDGLPDLYDAAYVTGDSVLTRTCEKQGVIRSCSPRAFDPAPDRLWLNEGAGQFRNVSAECGIDLPFGYGLGIVAADFEGNGQISLFIANDEVPNFLFVNQSTVPGGVPRFIDQSLTAGVAVDADGMSQACMGVAAGDADGDGLLDLYVTNFYRESNTLYRQVAVGQFSDVTRAARLRDPSYAMLGFGTQFLDADLDGWEDLIVTNGHIDDLTSIGEPYKMPSQFYRNLGRGRFVEIPARSLGSFFEEVHLGRGLTRVDWNRDGRDDCVISHIGEPAALLSNSTVSGGHFLAIRLRGTQCSRDAIGTTVVVAVGDRRMTRQLTAGDGYQASNERKLTFGLGTAGAIEELYIRWPSGLVQSWKNVRGDQEILVVEEVTQLSPLLPQ